VWEDEILNKETKKDVFDSLLATHEGTDKALVDEFGGDYENMQEWRDEYAAALQVSLPVIPKAVGEYIKDAKAGHNGLGFVLMMGGHAMTNNRIAFEEWLTRVNSYSDRIDRENTFALAWLLDDWDVEESE
jgi:hypothetical protein